MKRLRRPGTLLLAASVLAIASAHVSYGSAKLFVFAGQSNMSGYGARCVDLSSDLLAPNSAVQVLTPTAGTPVTGTYWVPASAAFYDYQPDVMAGADWWQYFNPGDWWVGKDWHAFGPDVTTGADIASALGETVYVAKYSVGATSLSWDWDPSNADPGSLYNSMLAWSLKALALLRQSDPSAEIAGFFWMQGEGDAFVQDSADAYGTNLTNLIAAVRGDFGNPNMPFIFGQVYAALDEPLYEDTLRSRQAEVALNVPNVAMVTTDSYSLSDQIHFGSASIVQMGHDFASAYLSLSPGGNVLPVASISGSAAGTVGEVLTFDGHASSDPDGSVSAYAWDLGDGAMSTQASVSHAYSAPGTYTVMLVVTDDAGASSSTALSVKIQDDPDSDHDGMADAWELANGLDPTDLSDAGADADADGLTNIEEFQIQTDPQDTDSDGDTLSDGAERNTYSTNPLAPDTDGDGLADDVEIALGTDPLLVDHDADGIPDGWEVINALDPTDPSDAVGDLDADGYSNLTEYMQGSDPNDASSVPGASDSGISCAAAAAAGRAPSLDQLLAVLLIARMMLGIHGKPSHQRS